MIRRPAPFTSPARALTAALVLATFVAACAGETGDATSDSTSGADSASHATSAGTSTGSIHLEVSGGPNAGSYDVDMPDSGCSYGLAGPTAWGNQYSIDTEDSTKFTSLQLVVPDAKAAASGTSNFQITAQFGPLFGSSNKSYGVNTRPDASTKSGSGTVTVEDHGTTGRVIFDAKTSDGVGLKGTIDCKSVVRNG